MLLPYPGQHTANERHQYTKIDHSPHAQSIQICLNAFLETLRIVCAWKWRILWDILTKKLTQRDPSVFNSPLEQSFWWNEATNHDDVLGVDVLSVSHPGAEIAI